MKNHVVLACDKPFGLDPNTAQSLNSHLLEICTEEQIFRVDHYLGKWIVDALRAFLSTRVCQGILNAGVSHVQISLVESGGIGQRGDFYNATGAVRDMMQNHIMQLLCIVARFLPNYPDADNIHEANLNVLKTTRLLHSVAAQYVEGEIDGKPVKGYCEEDRVPSDSTIPTYVAAKLDVNGIPFYARTGKRLAQKMSEISIHLISGEVLVFRLHPKPALILWSFHLIEDELKLMPMAFEYPIRPDAPYGVLLRDMMLGDQRRSVLSEEIEAAWEVVAPVLGDKKNCDYQAGSWGPLEADWMISRDGHRWWLPEQAS